jgi:hypothetical protein
MRIADTWGDPPVRGIVAQSLKRARAPMTAGYQMLIAGRWVDSFGVRLLMDAGDPYSICM